MGDRMGTPFAVDIFKLHSFHTRQDFLHRRRIVYLLFYFPPLAMTDPIATLVERSIHNWEVPGSIPGRIKVLFFSFVFVCLFVCLLLQNKK